MGRHQTKHDLPATAWSWAAGAVVIGTFLGGLRLLEYVNVPVAFGVLGVTIVALVAGTAPTVMARRAMQRGDELRYALEDDARVARQEFDAAVGGLEQSVARYTELAEPLHEVKHDIAPSEYDARNFEVRGAADQVERDRNAAWSAAEEWLVASRGADGARARQQLVEARLGRRAPGHALR